MHRFRSWTLDPSEWRTQRNRLLPIEGGDGSTLSLDFTQGTLDSRLTFTRGTNATFINSQGLVEWANSNMFWNTVWTSTSLPTGWLANPSNTGTITYNGDGTISCNASSQTAWIYPNFPYVETASGLSYICSVRVVSISAAASVNAILSSGNLTALEYFIDGVSKLASDSVTGPCVVSVRVTASGTQWFPRLGAGVQGVNVSFNLVMSEPHAHPGVAPRAYMANTSTSAANFNTPRFDYDPTTLQPRGLLIEATSNNLTALSESFAVSGGSNNWNPSGLNGSAVTATTQTNPAGLASSIRFVEDTANSAHTVFTAVSVTSGSQYTFSVFVRGDGTRTLAGLRITLSGAATDYSVIFDLADGTTGTAYTAGTPGTVTPRAVQHPGGWWRISVTMNAPAASTLFYIYNATTKNATAGLPAYTGTNNGIYVWGAQVELGSGASSYIPTGASQGSRAADYCTMPTSSFITGNPYPNTLFVDCIPMTPNAGFLNLARLFDRTAGGAFSYGNEIYYYTAATMSVNRKVSASTNTDRTMITGLAYNTRHKFASAIDSASFIGSRDGVTDSAATTAPAALASVVTHLGIGCNGDSTAVNVMNGWLRQIKFWPTALPQATLNSITTL